MYKCPICGHNRNNKLHTDKCSKKARETLASSPATATETKLSSYISIYDYRPSQSRFK